MKDEYSDYIGSSITEDAYLKNPEKNRQYIISLGNNKARPISQMKEFFHVFLLAK